MFYRENGQFKTSYAADAQLFPILQDRLFIRALLLAAFVLVPAWGSDYLLRALLIPFLILALAALGLNVLAGYCGQISLGTGAFMAVGAYAAFNLMARLPGMPLLLALLLAGLIAAAVGMVFGLPSLRIRGLYLAVATLAAQFLADWVFSHVAWLTHGSASGSVTAPHLDVFGLAIEGPVRKYLLCLTLLCVVALAVKNLVRGRKGREWMATRDMDVAASVIGISPVRAKLSAFGVSSFIAGIAGVLWAFVHLGSWEPAAFNIDMSFKLLFMIIIGGLGSVMGSFFGAAFIVLLPIALNRLPAMVGLQLSTSLVSHLELMVFGALIVFFLIVEPHGLARLWITAKNKLRIWPFPH
ncbi:Inner-membrane translocator [Thiomonas sp. X19]|uniref:branched-chain amino acid ABC transporter permease n=1 Tax=Thiomonas sp. X19 TaxID=1050370 RepID=UPI000B712747|nr:branched-chain amino acid ABC transporter permease [Thiomonas sp. X19]SCC95591.1 Inner-membrane translocator [Thiomonas sp. X19]